MSEEILTLYHFGKNNYYGHMLTLCDFFLKKNYGDPALLSWKLAAKSLLGISIDFHSELEPLFKKKDCSIAAPLIATYAASHALLHNSGNEDHKLKYNEAISSSAGEKDILHAALISHLLYPSEKEATRILSNAMTKSISMKPIFVSMAYVLQKSQEVLKIEEFLKLDPKNLFISYCYLMALKQINHQRAREFLSQVNLIFPDCIVFKMERLDFELGSSSQHNISDAIAELEFCWNHFGLNTFGQSNVESLKATVLQAICIDGDFKKADEAILLLTQNLQTIESENLILPTVLCKVFSRCAPFYPLSTLNSLVRLINTSFDGGHSKNPDFYFERGRLYVMMQRYDNAESDYNMTLKLDGGNLDALEYKIMIRLQSRQQLIGIEKDIDFQYELRKSSNVMWRLKFIKALLFHLSGSDSRNLCAESLQEQYDDCSWIKENVFISFGLMDWPLYFHNLLCLLEQVRLFGHEASMITKIENFIRILESQFINSPGSFYARSFLLYVNRRFLESREKSFHCIQKYPEFYLAYFIYAETCLKSGIPETALQILESCQSSNFSIRNETYFILLKSKTLRLLEKYPEAESLLSTCQSKELSTPLRIMFLLELADLSLAKKQYSDALMYLTDAEKIIPPSSPIITDFLLKKVDVEILKNNLNSAISLLNNIILDKENPEPYLKSRYKLADLFLNHLKDQKSYIEVYKNLVNFFPEFDTYIILADAYINANEIQSAVSLLHKLQKEFPDKDSLICNKIAIINFRNLKLEEILSIYRKAIIRNPQDMTLKFFLALSLKRLKKLEEAKQVYESTRLSDCNEARDFGIKSLSLMFLGDLVANQGSYLAGLENYRESLVLLHSILQKFGKDHEILEIPCSKLLGIINFRIAKTCQEIGDQEKALVHFNDCLTFDQYNINAHLELSKLHILNGDLQSAQACFSRISQIDPDNVNSLTIDARIFFLQKKYEDVKKRLEKLLIIEPSNWTAIWMSIETTYRITGNVITCDKFLLLAEKALGGHIEDRHTELISLSSKSFLNLEIGKTFECGGKASLYGGYRFCKGIFLMYQQKIDDAIKSFMEVRHCLEYGDYAAQRLFDLLLIRDGKGFEEYANKQVVIDSATSSVILKIIKEFSMSPLRKKVIQIQFNLITSKSKTDIDQNLNDLTEIVNSHKDNFSALYVLCFYYIYQGKQQGKAKSLLQKLPRIQPQFEDSYDFEKCLCLYAEVLIQTSKYNVAVDLLNEMLESNQKSAKIHELMGALKEKENDFIPASLHYETAWNLLGRASNSLAVKVAYINLKSKKYVEAIDAANVILGKNPNADRIRKDILEKARNFLRSSQ